MGRKIRYMDRRPDPPITEWINLPVIMDIAMVARLLGKSPETVRRKIIEGEIPAQKMCDEWRIRKDELMLHLGFLRWEVERYGYGMPSTARTMPEGVYLDEKSMEKAWQAIEKGASA